MSSGGSTSVTPSWDLAFNSYTKSFTADGSTVLLTFSGKNDAEKCFRVSRATLAHWSPVFRDMFSTGKGDSVVLHNEADEFEQFLWFIHVDPLSFADYMAKATAQQRFERAIGIASVANFYDAPTVTKWAISELLQYAYPCATPALLPKLHRVAHACKHTSPELLKVVIAKWRGAIQTSPDPVPLLLAAKDLKDEYLQGEAYLSIMRKKTNGEIADDKRLTTLDRLRILVGGMSLRRFEAGRVSYNTFKANERDWCPGLNILTSDDYNDRVLWDAFTRSTMGIVLKDDAEVEHLAYRPS